MIKQSNCWLFFSSQCPGYSDVLYCCSDCVPATSYVGDVFIFQHSFALFLLPRMELILECAPPPHYDNQIPFCATSLQLISVSLPSAKHLIIISLVEKNEPKCSTSVVVTFNFLCSDQFSQGIGSSESFYKRALNKITFRHFACVHAILHGELFDGFCIFYLLFPKHQ